MPPMPCPRVSPRAGIGDESDTEVDLHRRHAELVGLAGSGRTLERLRQATELGERAAARHGGKADVLALDATLFQLGALLELGRTDEALGVLDRYEAGALELDDPYHRWSASAVRADVARQLGRNDEADHQAAAAYSYAVAHGVEDGTPHFHAQVAIGAMLNGTIAGLMSMIGSEQIRALDIPTFDAFRAVALTDAGEHGRAHRQLAEVVEVLVAAPIDVLRPITLMVAARACVGLADATLASTLLPLLEPYRGLLPRYAIAGATLGPTDDTIADLLTLLRWEDAAELFREAAADLAVRARFHRPRTG